MGPKANLLKISNEEAARKFTSILLEGVAAGRALTNAMEEVMAAQGTAVKQSAEQRDDCAKEIRFWLLMLALRGSGEYGGRLWRLKANTRPGANASPSPAAIDVTSAAAIQRQLPRYFEATGSLAGDVQTDIQPQTAGKS